jgi:hypothetical protein
MVIESFGTMRPGFVEDSGPFTCGFRHGKAAYAHAETHPVLGILVKFFSVECSVLLAAVVLSHRELKQNGITRSLPFWCGPGDERRARNYPSSITRLRTYVLGTLPSNLTLGQLI